MYVNKMKAVLWALCWLSFLCLGCSSPTAHKEPPAEQVSLVDGGGPERTEVVGEKEAPSEVAPEKVAWQRKPPLLSACILKTDCKDLLAMGHRAVVYTAPENTLAALQEAHRLGADIAEIDVRLSKEGVPILLHDGDVDRVTNATGKADDMTVAQLQALTLKCPTQAKCTGKERIATLEEAVIWARGKLILNLDMKTSKLEPVLAVLRQHKAEDFVFLFLSSDSEYEAYQKYGQGFIMMPRANSEQSARDLVKTWKQPLLHLDPKPDVLTPALQAHLGEQGAKIMLNALAIYDSAAIQDPVAYLPLVKEYGAQVIQTDRLDLLVPYLQKLNTER